MDDMDFCTGYEEPEVELCSGCGKILSCGTIGLCQECQDASNQAEDDQE